jgi:hypothetical protein
MALAIRFDALIRDGEAPDYAALARDSSVSAFLYGHPRHPI